MSFFRRNQKLNLLDNLGDFIWIFLSNTNFIFNILIKELSD